MKHPNYFQLIDILRERELELFAIRGNFEELEDKFLQLENAFRTNLRVQKRLEDELELCKLAKSSNQLNVNKVDKIEGNDVKACTELYSSFTKIRIEKKRWKDAFLHQKKINDKRKLEHEQSIANIRNECENILKSCRENCEKHFRELLELYENSIEKVKHFEEALSTTQAHASSQKARILELSNLLQTLEKFQGVRSEMVCQRAAKGKFTSLYCKLSDTFELMLQSLITRNDTAHKCNSIALRSLANEGDKSYEEEMKLLRQTTWDVNKNEKNNENLEFLQAQNSVLREIVKSLKRKFQQVTSRDENSNKIEKTDDNPEENSRALVEVDEKVEKSQQENVKNPIVLYHETEQIEQPVENLEKSWKKAHCDNKDTGCANTLTSPRISVRRLCLSNEITLESQRLSVQSMKRDTNLKRIYIDAFESHSNGIPCVEYTCSLLNDRKLRVKHGRASSTRDSSMIVEFVNSEKDFDEASIDRIVFYLGDNVTTIVSSLVSGVHCGVQTKRVKTLEKCIQTNVTGTNGFSKLNSGVGILNSEKRAMERILVKLECTVASLKANTLGQARSIIKRDAKVLGDEFFNWITRLEH